MWGKCGEGGIASLSLGSEGLKDCHLLPMQALIGAVWLMRFSDLVRGTWGFWRADGSASCEDNPARLICSSVVWDWLGTVERKVAVVLINYNSLWWNKLVIHPAERPGVPVPLAPHAAHMCLPRLLQLEALPACSLSLLLFPCHPCFWKGSKMRMVRVPNPKILLTAPQRWVQKSLTSLGKARTILSSTLVSSLVWW